MNYFNRTLLVSFLPGLKVIVLSVAALGCMASNAVTIPDKPLVTQLGAKPMVMLVAGKDHKMFYEAYNDASDIDGDGTLDIRFKPGITYYGLFDSNVCYTHNSKSDNDGLFSPDSLAASGKCPGKWSGNWLNYMTTSRIDSMRKVLYGGYREVDDSSQTILRRAYIPQDAHTWGREYIKESVDGYKISDYTPLSQPTTDRRHFFGSLTANKSQSCATLDNCSNMPPLLRYRENVGGNARIWQWASKERPVLDSDLSTGAFASGTGTEKNRTVRVLVCTAAFRDGCKVYPNGAYKPVGLLHDYGENDSMYFGLLSGSYDKHMSGGRLRKVVGSFKDEVDANSGAFISGARIVTTFNNLRIRGFNQSSSSSEYWKSGPYDASAKAPTEGEFVDWGNPVAEMMYEATRYFAGKKAATSDFADTTTVDTAVGLKSVTWDDPFSGSSAAKAPWCARANFLAISDVYPSFDSDKVPGSYFKTFTGDLTGLNVKNEADTITAVESGQTGNHFIGQSNDLYDAAPTAKNVTSLGTIRGLAPGEPAKQGSYYAASVAHYAKRTDLRTDLQGKQTVDSYVVALTSPLPKIEVPVAGGKFVTLVPFSKTINHGGVISAAKGSYQPTNQIVDFYVETLVNSNAKDIDLAVNGGRYSATFIINYEDVEQGGDHDMDAIARYEVKVNDDTAGTVSVTVTPTYQAGGMKQNMGYVISGTTNDGVYLVAQDEPYSQSYFLNVPAGKPAGFCDKATPANSCKQLPTIGGVQPVFTFTPSNTPSATLLDDPLRFAAKWGGFNDKNSNLKPDRIEEWDADGNGVPDTYFLVQNPLKLKESLKRAFDGIFKTNSSASNVIANSSSVTTNSRVFQARFDSNYWSGDLVAYPVTASGVSSTTEWEASGKLPSHSARQLFIRTSEATTKQFLWSELPATDQAYLDTDSSYAVDTSKDVVNYLRGVRTEELQNTGNFRDRSTHVLGDIVHSSPFYEKDSDTIYVSANDGMLHAFKASNGKVAGSAGTELFGFIPSAVIPRLKNLTSTGYSHEYFVDGDVVVSPKTPETSSKNFLFAALGRGGKGLFSLDVSNPSAFGASDFLWEYTPAGDSSATNDGVMDATTNAATDLDLGYMLGRPVYVKMNNGQGAVVVGNGYNSTSGKAVLYIFLLNSSGKVEKVKKIDTLVGSDNGLASPGVFDSDGNGTIDAIYAGDLKGNVWKFDVSGATVASWSLALSGTPLFVAKNASNQIQPITAPITVAVDTVAGDTHEGKRFVFFGSGSYFLTGDPSETKVQTWYGLIDESAAITSRTDMRARSIAATGTFNGKPVRAFSSSTLGDMVGKKGWYLDFTSPAGERMITEPVLYKLATSVLVASSIIPSASDPCIPGGTGYVNTIGPFNGAALSVGILDINDNKNYTDDLLGTLRIGSVDLGIGLPSRPILIGKRLITGGTDSDPDKRVDDVGVNTGALSVKGRMSWREIIKD